MCRIVTGSSLVYMYVGTYREFIRAAISNVFLLHM